MKRRTSRGLWVSSVVVAGVAASGAACSSADPPLPPDPNPIIVTSDPPPPVSGGTMLVNGNLAIAADSDRDVVWVVDLQLKKVSSIPLQKGDEPGRVIQDGNGLVHVALRGAGAVATIDPNALRVVARAQVCSAPRGLVYDLSIDGIHVACAGGELVTLPAGGGPAIRSLRIADRDLRDVMVQNGNLLVTRFRSAEVLQIDASGALTNRQAASGLADPFLGTTFSPTTAWRTIASPNGGIFMTHQLAADGTVVISSPGGYGSSGGDDEGCDGSIVHTTVTSFDSNGNVSQPFAFINGASVAVDMAYDGDKLVLASAGSDSLFMYQPISSGAGLNCANAGQVQLPGQPVSVAITPYGYVAQIRELTANGAQGPALVLSDGSTITSVIALPGATRADTGHSLFHHNASATSAIACASCHAEGFEDGHVWVFDTLGSRRTQTVSGGVLATAPLHWNGDMTGLPDIMHEVFEMRMGGSAQGPRHVDAFATWLDSIPAYPSSPTGESAQIEHGRQIFQSANCAQCHTGAHYTSNQTVDVGTGKAFQVPTLIGVAARRPYMHDGCAATLEDRFDPNQGACNGGTKHGDTAGLSKSDIADLISFLETL